MSEHCVCSHAPNQHLHAPLGPWCMVPDCRCTGYKWACEQEDFRAIYQAEAAALRRFTRTSWMWIEYAAAVGLAYRHDSVNAVSGAVNAQWEKTSAAQAAEIAALKAERDALLEGEREHLETVRRAEAIANKNAEIVQIQRAGRERAEAERERRGDHLLKYGAEIDRLRGAMGEVKPEAVEARVYYMHDNFTFSRLTGTLDQMIGQAIRIEQESPHGMLCGPILVDAEGRDVRRIDARAHSRGSARPDEFTKDILAWRAVIEADAEVVDLIATRALAGEEPHTVGDGFGSQWPPCKKHTETLMIVRPGDARCASCENERVSGEEPTK